MLWPGLLLIFAGAVALAVMLARRQAGRAPLPRENETEGRPPDARLSSHEEEAARSEHGESEESVQEASSVLERESPGAAEGAPPALSPPEKDGSEFDPKSRVGPPETITADGGGAGDAPVSAGLAVEAEAAPCVSAEASNPIGEGIASDAAEIESRTETADQPPEEFEPEAREGEAGEAAEPDTPIAGAPAEHEAEASDPAAGESTADLAGEENDSAMGEAEPAEDSPETVEGLAGRKGPYLRRPAVHRYRRGMRRTPTGDSAAGQSPPPRIDLPPAVAALRLALHAIRRTVSLSLVLSRPEGCPERITLLLDGRIEAGAYDESRYDDIDVAWTSDLLVGELRIDSADGLRWVRSARRVHIFAPDPSEPDLVSVSAARAGADHVLICRAEDVPGVRAIAQQAGSPELVSHDHWQGIPNGWSVLSGYKPARATGPIAEAALRPLDPGADVDITLGGGLAIRPRVFAEGHPPRIEIRPVPESATVTIGGQPAVQNARGAWEAPGWDAPGQHIVDVVPGPSLSYEIAADPGNGEGWAFWNAHQERSGGRSAWSRAGICGAMLQGPSAEAVVAYETQSTMVALGASRGAIALERRPDANVSVALVAGPPAFLFTSSGPRRSQGRVIWLGQAGAPAAPAGGDGVDMAWVNAVYTAAVRRLPLVGADRAGEMAWRRAVLRARKLRRRRR
jgi:hypothetical protein